MITTTIIPRSGTSHTEDEWIAIRPLFTDLYAHQNKSLKEVADNLRDHHGFWATERMYKTHIRRWRLDKKNKERELLHVIRKARDAQVLGKTYSYRIRGKTKTRAEVKDYFRRKGIIDETQLLDRLPSSPTPSVLSYSTDIEHSPTPVGIIASTSFEVQDVCRSPDPVDLQQNCVTWEIRIGSGVTKRSNVVQPIPRFPLTHLPSPYKQTEALLKSTGDLFQSRSFTSAIESTDDSALDIINNFTEMLYGTCNAMNSRQYAQATELYGKMTDTLKSMMTTNDALCLALLYKILDGRRLSFMDATKVSILNFISKLSVAKFGISHPVARLVNCFFEEVDIPVDMVELGLRYALELLASSHGPLHPYTRRVVYRWCNALIAQGRFNEAIQQLSDLVSVYENDQQCGVHDSCWSLLQLGDCFYYIGQHSRAEETFRRALELSTNLDDSFAASISFAALMGIANCKHVLKDYVEAERMILLCLSMTRQAYGDSDYRTTMAAKTYADIKAAREGKIVDGSTLRWM